MDGKSPMFTLPHRANFSCVPEHGIIIQPKTGGKERVKKLSSLKFGLNGKTAVFEMTKAMANSHPQTKTVFPEVTFTYEITPSQMEV